MTDETPKNPIDLTSTRKEKSNYHVPSLNRSLHIEEGRPPHSSRMNIVIACSIVFVFIAWAAITPIDEVATASGHIIPTGFIKSVQHLEGGIINDIKVKEGEAVKAGQLLVTLDGKGADSELEQTLAREAGLKIKAERLRAIGSGQRPNFSEFPSVYENLVNDQQAIYDMQIKNQNDQRSVIEQQQKQQEALLAIQEGQERDIKLQMEVLTEQRDVSKNLYNKRLKTGTEYRSAEESVSRIRKELNQVLNQKHQTEQAIAESVNKLTELGTRLRNEALTEMGNVTAEIAQVKEALHKLQDRVNRLEIRAPVAGIIKGLKTNTLKGVIQPGEEIMQIVPENAMEVEAQINPRDVGNTQIGQNVTIKVSAYDFSRYGSVAGKLKSISASTFVDDDKKPYYKSYISLDQLYVGHNPNLNKLAVGMTVQADIHTGSKTLLQYLIKPVYNALKTSFRER
ncbi:MAG: HlyD family type I secretion periplasmic adaptor subunit [Alphaproteobacteria bacterium]|nr:HlyD family type I secretion periplasmic adaptor subunit [Alphaproteobacteria bacterium]